jgi:type IV secretory pathway TraG/TraD family ATPase VirD4
MKLYPPGIFIKDSLQRALTGIPKNAEEAVLEGQWIAIVKHKAIFDFFCSSAVSASLIALVLTILFKKDIARKDKKFLRGASLVSPHKINCAIKNYRITFGKEKVRFPENFENMGMFLFGSPGSGKSTFLKYLIPQITSDPAVIYDRKPEFYPLFYEQGKDLLLDPKDERTIRWNIFTEIEEKEDIDNIVNSMIPRPTDPKAAFWYQAARDIFNAILTLLRENGDASNKALIEFLYVNGCNRENLYKILKHDPRVEGYISRDNNTANSIMSVVSQFSNALVQRHFYHDGDFSIREFIRNGTGRLFIVNRTATEEAFKTYYTLFFDLAFREFLNRQINRSFRFWFIIDEFPSLMKLETLQRLLAEGRDRGSCPVIGAQDFEQVKKTYGPDAYSIFNQTNTKVIFRINDPNTTEYLSRAFGEQEFLQQVRILSAGTRSIRDGYNFSEQQKISRIILPSELKGMEALKGYISIGEYPVTQISLNIFNQPDINSMIPRSIPEIAIDKKQDTGEDLDELLK